MTGQRRVLRGGAAIVLALLSSPAWAGEGYVPDLSELSRARESELRDAVERYTLDRRALDRRFDDEGSAARREAMRRFHEQWREALAGVAFDGLSVEGAIDWVLLDRLAVRELARLDREEQVAAETAPLLPFAAAVEELHESLARGEGIGPEAAAARLDELRKLILETRAALESQDAEKRIEATKTVAHRAAKRAEVLKKVLEDWHGHYDSFDPLFTWWTKEPYQKTAEALESYVKFLREKIVGVKEGEEAPIVGDPIGREALMDDLAAAMIAYTPEELVAIGRRELAWCEAEMLKASRELGYGEDWKAALEHVKTLHVAPGEQPGLIRQLATEAIEFVESRDLLTIPQLAKDIWQVHMISPDRQKLNPFFFYNQDAIWVSYPTEDMTQEQKLMSMRGNNIHFARATAFHELIPGHHLQAFMTRRYNAHRQVFSTPFWGEGWALYWEMVLWDAGFPETPENKIGMLFWRMHRAARIIFSMSFHLGEMTPQEAIDFLVDRVGHERDNATAEVRRSFEGSYSPLYQIAYMIGALQFRALYDEVVGSGERTAREFHDAVLRGGSMPIEMVRARIKGEKPPRDFRPAWRFAGDF